MGKEGKGRCVLGAGKFALFLTMKIQLFSIFASLAAGSSSVHAASAFWSFQSVAAGTSGGYTGGVTSNSAFATAPSFSGFGGTGGATFGSVGGGVTATDQNTGTQWVGNGTTSPSVGYSTQWNSSSTANLTGAGFTLGLNTTNVVDLRVQFDLRSASSQNTTTAGQAGGITSFSAINYRTSPTGTWDSVGLTSYPTWSLSTNWQSGVGVIDLSSFNFLEGVAGLELQFIFNGGEKQLITPSGGGEPVFPVQNIRIDNLLVTAVPEPSSLALLGLGMLGLASRRRR